MPIIMTHTATGTNKFVTLLSSYNRTTVTFYVELFFFISKHFLRRLCTDFLETLPHDVRRFFGNSKRLIHIFYRAMHVVLARYCYRKSSVRPSVCPSVRL